MKRLSVSQNVLPGFYEHGADSVRIGQYVLKWMQWVPAGMEGIAGGPFIGTMSSSTGDTLLAILLHSYNKPTYHPISCL